MLPYVSSDVPNEMPYALVIGFPLPYGLGRLGPGVKCNDGGRWVVAISTALDRS